METLASSVERLKESRDVPSVPIYKLCEHKAYGRTSSHLRKTRASWSLRLTAVIKIKLHSLKEPEDRLLKGILLKGSVGTVRKFKKF